MSDLPPGFTLDEAPAQLPPGFTPDPQHPVSGPTGSFATDALRFLGTAAANAAAGIGSMADVPTPGINAMFNRARVEHGIPQRDATSQPTFENTREGLFQSTGATEYQPQTELGRMGMGATTAGVMALAGGMNNIPATLRAMPAALGAGGAGQLAADVFPDHPAVSAGAALLGGAAAQKGAQFVASPRTGAPGAISPEKAQVVQTARDKFDINIPAPMLSDSKYVKALFDQSSNLPFSGAKAARDANETAFQRGVARQIGETSDVLTPDVMDRARTRIGGEFNRVAGNTSIPVSNQMLTDLQDVITNAHGTTTEAALTPIKWQVDNIVNTAANNGGVISGAQYQALTKKGGPLDKMQAEPALRPFASELREVLQNHLAQHAHPDDLAALKTARGEWAALKTIEPLVKKSVDGRISPPSLMTRVATAPSQSLINGELGDLARVGQLLKPPADSGTAFRTAASGLLTGGVGGVAAGGGVLSGAAAGAGSLAASLLMNRVGNAAMRSRFMTDRLINGALGPGPRLPGPMSASQQLLSMGAVLPRIQSQQ